MRKISEKEKKHADEQGSRRSDEFHFRTWGDKEDKPYKKNKKRSKE